MEEKAALQSTIDEPTAEEFEQFVTFKLGNESFGISVLRVQSIIEMTDITLVPKTLHSVEGVINLRGSVVPVINLRKKFNMPHKEYDLFTVILIVEVKGKLIGVIVDSVSDVLSIPVDNIQNNINVNSNLEDKMIHGVGRVNDNLVILVEVEAFLETEISKE